MWIVLLVHSSEPLAEFVAWDGVRSPHNPGMGLPGLGKHIHYIKNTIAMAQSGPGWTPPRGELDAGGQGSHRR